MIRVRYFFCFLIVLGVSISAHNQDLRFFQSINEGVLIVKAVFVDSEGVKWFGTNRGLCRYDDLTWTYYTELDHLAGNQVNALSYEYSESGDSLWVATSEGVSVLAFDTDGVTGSKSYTTENGLLNDNVLDIQVDSRHGKFFGSEGGITWFHDGIMDSILFKDYYSFMFNSPVRKMDICKDTLYIAQAGGIGRLVSGVVGISGASRWDGDYVVSPFSNDIYSVYVKGEEIQYFGTDIGVETHTGYFAKANWDLLSSDMGLVDNTVISIAEDSEDGLWFGTLGGVSQLYDGSWTSYTTADGLLNDTVYDIGFDPDGSVWFGTGAGACRLKDGAFQDFYTALPGHQVSTMQLQAYYRQTTASIHMEYWLEQQEEVYARLYDIRGILVAQWRDLSSLYGQNYMELSLPDQSPGEELYILQLSFGSRFEVKKILVTQ